MKITFPQLRHELILDKYLTASIGIFAMDKHSILYQGMHYWGSRYHVNLKHCWNVTHETPSFIWLKLPVSLNEKQFSHYLLNDTVKSDWHDFATEKFLQYINNRKTLYNIHLFRNFHNLTTGMDIPRCASNRFYTQIRLHGIMKNIENGWLNIDYNHLPMSMSSKFGTPPTSKGDVLYRLAFEYPYLFISRQSLLWLWIQKWYSDHNLDINKGICGLQFTKHYVYVGMSYIYNKSLLSSNLRKPRHPQEYSGVDYYIFHGNSNGIQARKFISWIRDQMGLQPQPQKSKQLSLKLK